MISSSRYQRDGKILADIIKHLGIISNKAIEGNEGEVNTVLLGQVISFYDIISPHMKEDKCEFNIVSQLSALLDKCHTEHDNQNINPRDSAHNIDACISTISENAPPMSSLQVLSQCEHMPDITSSSLLDAIHTSLIRGARDGVRSELSGSLLKIQRAREEGRRPVVEHDEKLSWRDDDENEELEEGGIWTSILNGTLEIEK